MVTTNRGFRDLGATAWKSKHLLLLYYNHVLPDFYRKSEQTILSDYSVYYTVIPKSITILRDSIQNFHT